MRAPEFWRKDGRLSRALAPLGSVYAWGAARLLERAEQYRPAVPVICVGNVVAGGAGKTPVAIALAQRLIAAKRQPHFLSRGHGGTEIGPRAVDPLRHDAARVGDEPLLLAAYAPTWVARDRSEGAVAAIATGADLIVMDDGFQSGRIAIDLGLLVVDGTYGFGNGRVIPAGPCREPPERAFSRADALVLVGEDRAGLAEQAARANLPVLEARLVPSTDAPDLNGRRVVAFAGIGLPEKFFATLRGIGATIVTAHPFPDHHPYARAEIEALLAEAEAMDAQAVTTAKDRVRLPSDLRERVMALPVELEWRDPARLTPLLDRIGVVA
ncbi:tetraacyldisaccharide 4'-kinase [Magnetospirillum molischianum]|uniref:Tetraacyldisaccharide 4'-kinase n=1 Tax=Magnetospirillum molischianum DSM 120 TaxID=1150626 RepID=H8FU02_MAGML|nr:tetraacyldisaccharide 4'-kinase [Magnetospirillum molischianum]CCG41726.1 Tetraacyldisaccharide 4'-kinase (Lipid A 4'-kinase) [Magnetospirillum molischianum DSM 120]